MEKKKSTLISELKTILEQSKEVYNKVIPELKEKIDDENLKKDLEIIRRQMSFLQFALESSINRIKDLLYDMSILREQNKTLNKETEKVDKIDYKKVSDKFLKGHYKHIIESIKRASIRRYGTDKYPVRPEEIVEQFRIIAPNAKVATETITRVVRKMAELGYITRVKKGLYRVN